MIILLLAIGGAFGTIARYGVGQLIPGSPDAAFPWATLLINVTGSFLLGVVVALADRAALTPEMRNLLGVGFCGAFTTFSTFSVETLSLIQGGQTLRAAVYVTGSVLTGLLAAAAGIRLAG